MQSEDESADEGCKEEVFAEECQESFSACCRPGWEDVLAPVDSLTILKKCKQYFCHVLFLATFEVKGYETVFMFLGSHVLSQCLTPVFI